MELPRRTHGEELLAPGDMTRLRARLRALSPKHDIKSVIACAFDHRTRMLPFVYADMRMIPAGVRAIGSAMVDAGFPKTRIVLQQWNRNFRPSKARIDGQMPDILMISSMYIHFEPCKALLRDACGIEPSKRPLIIVGGPKVIYEPWDVFSADPADPWAADVAVTGEEYILLSLLEALLSLRGANESIRRTFLRARDQGLLDGIPGLVYARGAGAVPEELVDTGIQRLLGCLDELPSPTHGFKLMEPPSRRETLGTAAIPASRIAKYNLFTSLVMTSGCKFSCPYCPIPAYNQRQHRVKSGQRIADEMHALNSEFGLKYFFGADDNFFNDDQRALAIMQTIMDASYDGRVLHRRVRWGTEATVHDVLRMREHLPLAHRSGLRALWIGVEDLTATLVKKGQGDGKTQEAFGLLVKQGISPMPMMIHHDEQPLYTRDSGYGLLNQARTLRKAGAINLQVLMMTPATGSKLYESTYSSGMVIARAGGRTVEPRMFDGNYVISSLSPRPWRKQMNLIATYMWFNNPLRLIWSLFRFRNKLYFTDLGSQALGMLGLLRNIRRTFVWTLRLRFGRIERSVKAPVSAVPMRDARGGPASHAMPGTPLSMRKPSKARVAPAPAPAQP